MDYAPETAPDPEAWLALPDTERIQLAIGSHLERRDDALHTADMNLMMHGTLHAIVETQVASGVPPVTGLTLERLQVAGLTRHAAVHGIMRVLMEQIADLAGDAPRFDEARYTAKLEALVPADLVARGLARIAPPGDEAPMNRAQRRAAKKADRKR